MATDSRGDLCPLRMAEWLRTPVRLCRGAEAAILAGRDNANAFRGVLRALQARQSAKQRKATG